MQKSLLATLSALFDHFQVDPVEIYCSLSRIAKTVIACFLKW